MTAEIVEFPAPKAKPRSTASESMIELLEGEIKKSQAAGLNSADLDPRHEAEELYKEIESNIRASERRVLGRPRPKCGYFFFFFRFFRGTILSPWRFSISRVY